MTETILQITGLHRRARFCAGIVLEACYDGLGFHVIEVAPILRRYFPKGSTWAHVRDYCRERGWTIKPVALHDK